MDEKFLKPYDFKATEEKIYTKWEKSGYFNPDNLPGERNEPFSIVLPPPNVTGTLHMGHAAMLAIEDILIRYKRMRGFRALWIPGTDSAAIATQAKVEGDMYKQEKKTRHDLGREELLKRIGQFTEESKATIINQTKKMGSSLDWSRYAYTMDEKRYGAVMEAFVRMYNAGLIYRGDRIVNWDPKLQTTVSDDEIEYIEQKDSFYHFTYGPFEIGTVRPETKFGDKYVVMHPDDARYAQYAHGQKIELEWINGPLTATVIKDEAADREFGSGVMTITPAHSGIDFEIAKRHGLDIEPVIDDRGILLPIAGEFAGQHIKKVRPLIVQKLKEKGLVVKVDEGYTHNIATNSRGGGIIEPQIKRQWFVAVEKEVAFPNGKTMTLKNWMREVVSSRQITIMPEHFEKIYYHWIDNLRDWCISRQIWFGHRIPAWYCAFCNNDKGVYIGSQSTTMVIERKTSEPFAVSVEKPLKCTKCHNNNLQMIFQEPDTLDTWFSSGLWTFSTLGWPAKTEDLKIFHPTSVLETGYDILFFWVARMILMSGFLLGDVPFRAVYLHGLVRDAKGKKMSKSLGNSIDPLEMIEKYGADAVRLSLIMGAAPGNDIKLSEDRVRGYKHFANKVWNISRFVLENLPAQAGTENTEENAALLPEDRALVDEARGVATSVSVHLEGFRLDLAADTAYHYVWDRFAAVILEESKPLMKDGDAHAVTSRKVALLAILKTSLALLHPFMPYVTEEIWSDIPGTKAPLLMVETWPA